MIKLLEIEYLKDKSTAPQYLFRVKIAISSRVYEDIVIYTPLPDRRSEFDFGKLTGVMDHLTKVEKNTVLSKIRNTKL